MTPEEVWQRKTDRDVLIAAHQLESYTEGGRRVILQVQLAMDHLRSQQNLVAAGVAGLAAAAVGAAAWAVATLGTGYHGFRFSVRRISQEELAQLVGRS